MPTVVLEGDVLTLGGETVALGGEDVGDTPPTDPGISTTVLYIDGIETGAQGWNCSFERVLGATGRAVITVQDRDPESTWEPQPHADVRVTRRSSGRVLFRGEILTPHGELPMGTDIRFWTLTCHDYNAFVREAKFGAPTGGLFWRPNDRENYRSIDPGAISGGGDDGSIQTWLSDSGYRHTCGGTPIDTATYVFGHSLVSDAQVQHYDDRTDLGSAIDELASLCEVNVQDWLDKDMKWHHQAIPTAAELLADGDAAPELDEAPFAIGPGEDGHHMGLAWDQDGKNMPEQIFLQGATEFMHEDGHEDAAGASGWYPEIPDFPNVAQAQDPTKRQAYLSAPSAVTREKAIAIARSALVRAASPTLRMSFTISGENLDQLDVGQVLTINDSRLPPSLQGSHKFVIQRIAGNLEPGLDRLRFQIDVGDGAVSRANQGGAPPTAGDAATAKPVKKPFVSWLITFVDDNGAEDLSPIGAGESRNVLIETSNALGEQHQPEGTSIDLSVVAIDADPDSPTFGDTIADQGSFDPNPTTTDQDGRARSTFTAGDMDGLSYTPIARSPLPQV